MVHRARNPGLAEAAPRTTLAIARCAPASLARQPASHAGSQAVALLAPSVAASSHASTPLWWNSVATRNGSAHCPKGSTTTTRAPRASGVGDVVPEGTRQPRGPEEHDAFGKGRPAPDDGVRRADRPLHAAARQRIGQHGPAEAIAQGEDARRDRAVAASSRPRPASRAR